ncbi:MAG: substrate-binding domain-containing protein [Bacteroidota bacterium]
MKRLPRTVLVPVLVCILALNGCYKVKKVQNEDGSEEVVADRGEGATRGEINIGVDESMVPVLKQEVSTFMMLYPEATLNPKVAQEATLVTDLLNDSLRLILIGRELTARENDHIQRSQIVPKATLVGRSAIALICHPDNPIDSLTEPQLRSILRGEIQNWSELGGEDLLVNVVYDHPLSGVVRYVQDRFLDQQDSLPRNAFTADSTEAVINYVHQSPNAIGLVGFAWLADRDSRRVKEYLNKVELVRMQAPKSSDMPGAWVRPFQAEIKMGRWPITRPIYAVSREHFSGLGTGFVVFLAGERGQSVLLKAGLVPEFTPPREVVLPAKNDDNS